MTAQIKRCIDCRWAMVDECRYVSEKHPKPPRRHDYLCSSPDARQAEPVGGYMLTCYEQRSDQGVCKLEAMLYERRA